jgi:hypothetical protein
VDVVKLISVNYQHAQIVNVKTRRGRMGFAEIQLIPGACVHTPTLSVTIGTCQEFLVTVLDENQCPIDLTPFIEPEYDNPAAGKCSARMHPITTGIIFTVKTHKCDSLPVVQKLVDIEGNPEDGVVAIPFEACDFTAPGLYLGELQMIEDGCMKHVYRMYIEVEASLAWQSSNSPITIAEIRLWVRDNCPEDNFLLDEVEYKDSEIIAAIRRAVDMWNESPPIMTRYTYTYTNFPYRSAWIDVTIGFLKRIAAEWYIRNHLPYQAGGVSVDDKNKYNQYKQDSEMRIQKFQQWMNTIKPQLNAGQAWSRLGYRDLPTAGY